MKIALMRQFPISAPGRVEQMRYSDFQELMKPKNKQFQSYVQRKLKAIKDADLVISTAETTEAGISF